MSEPTETPSQMPQVAPISPARPSNPVGRPRIEVEQPNLAARTVALIESGFSQRQAEKLGITRRSIGRMFARNQADFAPVRLSLARQWSLIVAGCLENLDISKLNPMQQVITAGIGSDKIAKLTEQSSGNIGAQVNIQVNGSVSDLQAKLAKVSRPTPSTPLPVDNPTSTTRSSDSSTPKPQ